VSSRWSPQPRAKPARRTPWCAPPPGTVAPATLRPAELDRQVITCGTLTPAEAVRLPARPVDRVHRLELGGSMMPYRWTINGATFEQSDPLRVRQGERVRLEFVNRTSMFHPMHVHGHTFAVADGPAKTP
jgi:multicopper oxidase